MTPLLKLGEMDRAAIFSLHDQLFKDPPSREIVSDSYCSALAVKNFILGNLIHQFPPFKTKTVHWHQLCSYQQGCLCQLSRKYDQFINDWECNVLVMEAIYLKLPVTSWKCHSCFSLLLPLWASMIMTAVCKPLMCACVCVCLHLHVDNVRCAVCPCLCMLMFVYGYVHVGDVESPKI